MDPQSLTAPPLPTAASEPTGLPVRFIRPDEPGRPLQRVMLLILALTLASTCLLTSAGEGSEAGSRPWGRNSILHVVTDLANLSRQFPTHHGTEVKWLTQSLGAGAALICAAAAWFLRTRRDPDAEPSVLPAEPVRPFAWLARMSPPTAAQVALVLFVGFSALSALWPWSIWPEVSRYEALRGGIVVLLAISLGRCLSRTGACRGAMILSIVLVATAIVGIWYHYERNPVQRLKYPIGNPIFFAACLLPAVPLLGARILSIVLSIRSASVDGRPKQAWLSLSALTVGLIVLLWALVQSDSRGPGLGLALGVFVAALLLVNRRIRVILTIGAGVAAIMFVSLKLWPVSWLLSRPDTIRARLYTWKYAFQMFFTRPDIGRGQGAYFLLSQKASRPDAEADPLAFAGELVGHAHNEWLEILADLGAFGLALMLTAICVTLWAAVVAWRRTSSSSERWTLAGLLAGFLAIIFESATDVGLRMPGLPVIFYTTWGLLWAMCGQDSARSHIPAYQGGAGKGLDSTDSSVNTVWRAAGLLSAIAAAWAILTIASRDWQAALADPMIVRSAERLQWEQSIEAAAAASQGRLWTEGRLDALQQAVRFAHDAAAHRASQLQEMIRRAPQAGGDPAPLMRLAHEDVAAFEDYSRIALDTGRTLLHYCPAYPGVAGFLCNLWLMRSDIANLQEQVGSLSLTTLPANPLDQARQWLQLEYQANRLNAEVGLRLLQLSEDQDMVDRLNMIRIPLRSGPMHPSVEAALVHLVQDKSFGAALDALVAAASPAIGSPPPWADPYSPETFRLGALAHKLRGTFETAAAMAGQAAALLAQIQDRFPNACAYAMADQARYLLLGDPVHPGRALKAMLQALSLLPEKGSLADRQALERGLPLYLLAAGQEDETRRLVASLLPSGPSQNQLDRSMGAGYAELCQRFMIFPPERRPPQFGDWLQRALLLAPDRPEPRILATRVTLEKGQQDMAIENLQALEKVVRDPQDLAPVLNSLLAQFPNAAELRAYVTARLAQPETASQPAGGNPSPATHPASPAQSPENQPILE